MYKRSATELKCLNRKEFQDWLDSFDYVLSDCDGVIWLKDVAIPNCCEALTAFQELGKDVYLVTNNSRATRNDLVKKAKAFGISVDASKIVGTAHETAKYLKSHHKCTKVFVIGNKGLFVELDEMGIAHTELKSDSGNTTVFDFIDNEFQLDGEVNAVVVGFDDKFDMRKMTLACSYLNNPDCIFIATNTDEKFPMNIPNVVMPGTGSIVKSIETCSNRSPIIIGKPNKNMVKSLIADGSIKPERTLMIGDRCNTDIAFGHNCGFQTLLVGTGIHNLEYVKQSLNENDSTQKLEIPDFYLPSLGDIVKLIDIKK